MRSRLRYVPALQEVVNLIIGHAIDILVRPQRRIGFKVGGRDLEDQIIRCTEMRCERSHAPFREARERQDIGGAVAEFGIEAQTASAA